MKMKDSYLILLMDTLCGESYGDGQEIASTPVRRLLKFLFPNLMVGWRNRRPSCWPLTAATMVSAQRLNNFGQCIELAIRNRIPGDVVECGVWRGGASIYATAVLWANHSNKKLLMFDSFAGLPKASMPQDSMKWSRWSDVLSVTASQVRENFRRFHICMKNVEIVEGWFSYTLPKFKMKISVLRCDGDMYESTMDILVNLYDQVSPGGFIIIDDFTIPCCRQALRDFFSLRGGEPEYIKIDKDSAFFVKQKS